MEHARLVEGLRQALIASQPELDKWLAYYNGKQNLAYLSPELARELEGRVRSVIINWPRLVVDSIEERLDVEGFRLNGAVNEYAWDAWQANGLDEASQQAHQMALTTGRAYVIVGSEGPDGYPLVTVESPSQVFAARDPRTRKVSSALKMWTEETGDTGATLYLPDRTLWLRASGDTPVTPLDQVYPSSNVPSGSGWEVIGEDVHNLGTVPVVPIVNREAIVDKLGVSELADIVPLSDAAVKAATDMMVSAEFHAIPRRWIVGMSEADMSDEEGRPLSKWDKLAGRIWAVDGLPSETQLGQFQEADLRNFHETIKALSRLVASIAGLPPHFLAADGTANPASADAIRSAETRLVKRAERRQRAYGAAWEDVARLVIEIGEGSLPEDASKLETIWSDASSPTVAQRADAVVKLRTAGIVPLEQSREDLGYTVEQREIMRAEDEREALSLASAGMAPFLEAPQEEEEEALEAEALEADEQGN